MTDLAQNLIDFADAGEIVSGQCREHRGEERARSGAGRVSEVRP
jgi:hypothetical protein